MDRDSLEGWLRQRALIQGRLSSVEPLGEGHSNLTYALRADERVLVLRRPPEGSLLPTAHDVLREFRVVALLAEHAPKVRIPVPVDECSDAAVIGVPFALYEPVEGEVIREDVPAWLDNAVRRSLGLDLAVALAEIHTAPWQPFVDAGIGKASGYLDRQLKRWTGQREGIRTVVAAAGGRARELPDYDAVRDWLIANVPEEAGPAIVHGDYKLDNVIVGKEGKIRAVLDWEMATVGDPRADLGYLLFMWPEPGEQTPLLRLPSAEGGFPARAELVSEWESRTSRKAGATRWFVALAGWKLAILLEASYHRWLAGTADDPMFARLDEDVPALLRKAREACGA